MNIYTPVDQIYMQRVQCSRETAAETVFMMKKCLRIMKWCAKTFESHIYA